MEFVYLILNNVAQPILFIGLIIVILFGLSFFLK